MTNDKYPQGAERVFFERELYTAVSNGEISFLTFGEMAETLRTVADDIDPSV